MRSFLILMVCFGALVGGVLLSVVCANHAWQIAQAATLGTSIYTASTVTPAPDEPGWHSGVWTPPKGPPPAHENWTWQMKDGKTYQNVVITDVSSTEVTITHSLGVAHLPLDSLPRDVQEELQYTSPPVADTGTANPASPGP
jgi:hypothetical protein